MSFKFMTITEDNNIICLDFLFHLSFKIILLIENFIQFILLIFTSYTRLLPDPLLPPYPPNFMLLLFKTNKSFIFASHVSVHLGVSWLREGKTDLLPAAIKGQQLLD